MANFFVRSSDGSDSDNGSTWALAKATLAAATTAAAAGDTVFVSKNHSESVSSAAFANAGTHASPIKVLCVDDAGDPASPTTLATTAVVATTTSGAITFASGVSYWYGITFQQGSGSNNQQMLIASSTTTETMIFDNCKFIFNTTNGGQLRVGSNNSSLDIPVFVIWKNCTVKFSHAIQCIACARCDFQWLGGSVDGTGTIPTTLFGVSGFDLTSEVLISGVDLSALGSGKNLFDVAHLGSPYRFMFRNCKINASVTLTTGTRVGHGDTRIMFRNVDSGNTNYKFKDDCYEGTISDEIVIVQTSPAGASDESVPISFKMVSTANSHFYWPLKSPEIIHRQTAVGSAITVTVDIVNDGVTLTDADVWLEVEYLGTSSLPTALFASDRAASILATPANQDTDTSTWTTTGLGSPVYQKLVVSSITPRLVGNLRCTVCLAKASQTIYVNPKVTVT